MKIKIFLILFLTTIINANILYNNKDGIGTLTIEYMNFQNLNKKPMIKNIHKIFTDKKVDIGIGMNIPEKMFPNKYLLPGKIYYSDYTTYKKSKNRNFIYTPDKLFQFLNIESFNYFDLHNYFGDDVVTVFILNKQYAFVFVNFSKKYGLVNKNKIKNLKYIVKDLRANNYIMPYNIVFIGQFGISSKEIKMILPSFKSLLKHGNTYIKHNGKIVLAEYENVLVPTINSNFSASVHFMKNKEFLKISKSFPISIYLKNFSISKQTF